MTRCIYRVPYIDLKDPTNVLVLIELCVVKEKSSMTESKMVLIITTRSMANQNMSTSTKIPVWEVGEGMEEGLGVLMMFLDPQLCRRLPSGISTQHTLTTTTKDGVMGTSGGIDQRRHLIALYVQRNLI